MCFLITVTPTTSTGNGTITVTASANLTSTTLTGAFTILPATSWGTAPAYLVTAKQDASVISYNIDATAESNSASVYPNPVKDELTIEMPNNNKILNFEKVNTNGKIVYTGKVMNKTTILTSSFVSGMYLLKIENAGNTVLKKNS